MRKITGERDWRRDETRCRSGEASRRTGRSARGTGRFGPGSRPACARASSSNLLQYPAAIHGDHSNTFAVLQDRREVLERDLESVLGDAGGFFHLIGSNGRFDRTVEFSGLELGE